jgi:hypothetical protein
MKLFSIPVALVLVTLAAPALAAPKAHRAPAPAPAAMQPVGLYPADANAAAMAPDAALPQLPAPGMATNLPAPGARPEYRQPRPHRQPQPMPPALPE